MTTLAVGTLRLYDFVDNNPLFSFNPTEYVNDPLVIGRQNKMVAINTRSRSISPGRYAPTRWHQFYSGVGGQADFNQDAARSLGDQPIVALPSSADGALCRASWPRSVRGRAWLPREWPCTTW